MFRGIYIYLLLPELLCEYKFMGVDMFQHLCLYVWVYSVCVCFLYTRVCICVFVSTSVYVCLSLCICVFMYVCILMFLCHSVSLLIGLSFWAHVYRWTHLRERMCVLISLLTHSYITESWVIVQLALVRKEVLWPNMWVTQDLSSPLHTIFTVDPRPGMWIWEQNFSHLIKVPPTVSTGSRPSKYWHE